MLDFILECEDFSSKNIVRIRIRNTRDGEMSFTGYDYDASAAWAELSQTKAHFLDAIDLWEVNPIGFLLKYAPSSAPQVPDGKVVTWA